MRSMTAKRNDVVRVQLDLPAERITELELLMDKTRLSTRKDLFENALTLFEWAVQQREQGRTIASVAIDGEGYYELLMPALSLVKNESTPSNASCKERSR
jgi:hypothetical protein